MQKKSAWNRLLEILSGSGQAGAAHPTEPATATLQKPQPAPGDPDSKPEPHVRSPEKLHPGLTCQSINIIRGDLQTFPENITARRIKVRSQNLRQVGAGLCCNSLDFTGTQIEELPDDLSVRDRLDLGSCRHLRRLPDGLTTGSLVLSECTALAELPKGLDVTFLDLSGCTSLRTLPDDMKIRGGSLSLRGCPWITKLPVNLGAISELDLSGCLNLSRVPEGLEVTSWIDLAGTSIRELPPNMRDVGLRWNGMPVNYQIVFEPETLDAKQILSERNAELRRVMMERVGYERLLEAIQAEVLDQDEDPGGERRLLRIAIEGDEDLVCVSVKCPSTGHQFILRVPPTMTTCRQAVAWTAGYDDPAVYAPVQET